MKPRKAPRDAPLDAGKPKKKRSGGTSGSKATDTEPLRLEAEREWAQKDRRRAQRARRVRSWRRKGKQTANLKEELDRAKKTIRRLEKPAS